MGQSSKAIVFDLSFDMVARIMRMMATTKTIQIKIWMMRTTAKAVAFPSPVHFSS